MAPQESHLGTCLSLLSLRVRVRRCAIFTATPAIWVVSTAPQRPIRSSPFFFFSCSALPRSVWRLAHARIRESPAAPGTRSFMLRFSKAQDGGKCRLLRKSLAGRRSTRWRPCPCLLPCQDHLLKMLFSKGCLSLMLPTYCIVSTEEILPY